MINILVGGLEHFLFFHILGIIFPTDYYFSEGLKPPTSIWLFVFNVMMFGTSMMFCHHDHNELVVVVFSNVCYTCVSWSLCWCFRSLVLSRNRTSGTWIVFLVYLGISMDFPTRYVSCRDNFFTNHWRDCSHTPFCWLGHPLSWQF